MLVIAEFSTIVSVTTLTATCEDLADSRLQDQCQTTGGEQHSYALLLLAVLVALMTWGTVAGASRPAAFALVAMGIVVIVIAVALDLPDTNDEGLVGINFEEANANPGAGLWIELVAGALALLAGVLGLLGNRRSRRAAT